MDVFFHAAAQMVVLFILLLVGVIARKKRMMNDRFDTMLSQIIMNIALPAMILNSVLSNDNLPDPQTIGIVLGCATLVYVLIIAIAEVGPRLYPGKSASSRGAHSFMISFGNVGFMGFPVLGAIFGPQAVLYGAIYNIPFNVAAFSLGVNMVSRKDKTGDETGEKKSLLDTVKGFAMSMANPCMAACLIAIVLALLHINDINGVIGMSCNYLGQLTVPASMLIIGSSLAKMSIKSMVGHLTPYISSIFRLLIVPIAIYFIFGLFVSDKLILGVLTMSSAMPVAGMGTMLCLVHGGDLNTMMRGTFLTTLMSLVTIPAIAMLIV